MSYYKEAIKEGENQVLKVNDPTHDIVHIRGVIKTALKIAKSYPCADKKVLEIAAWWHDVARQAGANHKKLSAQLAVDFLKEKWASENICNKVYSLINEHSWESEAPKTIEGKILHDADKLDYISLTRWKHVIELKDDYYMVPFIKRIGKLKDSLILKESKTLYDKLLPKFKSLILSNNWKSLDEIKKAIKDL